LLFRHLLGQYAWLQTRYLQAIYIHQDLALAQQYFLRWQQSVVDIVDQVQAMRGTCSAPEWTRTWQAHQRHFANVVENNYDAAHYITTARLWMGNVIETILRMNVHRVSDQDRELLLQEWIEQEDLAILLIALLQTSEDAVASLDAFQRHMLHWSDLFSRLVVTQAKK
jgi:hypothetical protein